ncbi:MAG: hypothetical protein R2705_24450 [Ilumatobacteraceae bacterium]
MLKLRHCADRMRCPDQKYRDLVCSPRLGPGRADRRQQHQRRRDIVVMTTEVLSVNISVSANSCA